MKNNKNARLGIFEVFFIFIGVMVAQSLLCTLLCEHVDIWILLAITVVIDAAAALVGIARFYRLQKSTRKVLSSVGKGLGTAGTEILQRFKMPVLITDYEGKIVWYNNRFDKLLERSTDLIGLNITDSVMTKEDNELLNESGHADIMFRDKLFAVYQSNNKATGREDKVLYFVDQTQLKQTASQYRRSRPAVIFISVDNMDEIAKAVKESEKGLITSSIQTAIENWAADCNAIVKRIGVGFMLILEESGLQALMEERFKILDTVRKITFGDSQVNATLSIGVGHKASSFRECEILAQQALEMAIGRDGDQAAVKTPDNEYKFFGGVAKAVERSNKARARLMASVLSKLIDGSDRVVLMGHKASDMDCIGPAYALWQIAQKAGKEAHIVVDYQQSLATELIDYIKERDPECDFTDGRDIVDLIDRKTLLIVVDVQRPSFVDNKEIYDRSSSVVVIDHHRKAVEHIENAVLFYHETSASSTSEMVAEMLQYMGNGKIPQLVAQSLLTGIMLDTKNYVQHTGTRTFEASAYLRLNGANPQSAKQMLCGDIGTYRQRAAIMATAEYYGDCAIAVNEIRDKNSRLATSQAADELLNIQGVKASFVMCYLEGAINISARSAGDINVQVIMEALGGGGHGMMAACQIDVDDIDKARQMLFYAIDEYRKNNEH
ncbi:MAG: DHH family phosphoesterase [Clostridia bacterium]|nr:DHH family phosphoesterase [Clostridia bacterium]